MVGSERRLRLGAALWLLAALACSRRAEIADEPDGGLVRPNVPSDDAGLESVDAGLGGEEFARCAERMSAPGCRGTNDFPCNFQAWVSEVVAECQVASGCRSNGRVLVEMGEDGCVADLLMSEPNADFVRCAGERFGSHRCECRAQRVEEILGYGNAGCLEPVRCTGESRCPEGEQCVEGYCEREVGSGGVPG